VTPRPGLSPAPGAAYRGPVRAHGVVTDVPEAGRADHICWVYEGDDAAFDRAVGRFLTGGLDRGERLLVVGDRAIASLDSPSSGLTDVEALLADGTLQTLRLGDAYDATSDFLPQDQFAFYDAATRRAIDDGYQGLRVVAEVSELAADPDRRAALARWEHLADDYIASGSGFTAMCAYSGELDAAARDDLTAVHPLVHAPGPAPAFQIFFDDAGGMVLTGSVDTFSADRLARVLASSPAEPPAVVLDLGRTEFMDLAACRVLARWAASLSARSVAVELARSSALVRRMWQLLSLDEVAPVTFIGSRS
jgi:anti-anti-sigma regulatory factor